MTDDTRKPVEELSGRELDAAVAREVLGREPVTIHDEGDLWLEHEDYEVGYEGMAAYSPLPRYSTDIAAAWEVVERSPGSVVVQTYPDRVKCYWSASRAVADAAPEAICRAALKAVREVDDE